MLVTTAHILTEFDSFTKMCKLTN